MLYQDSLQDKKKANTEKISCYVYKSIQPSFPNHCHSHLELIYILDGHMRFFLDGESKICKKGDLVFVPILKPHAISYVDNCSSEHMVLQLNMKLLNDGSIALNDKSFLSRGKRLKKDIAINIADDCLIGQILWELHCLCEQYLENETFTHLKYTYEYTYEKGNIINFWKLKGLVFRLFSELLGNKYIVFSDDSDYLEDINELSRIQPVLQSMISHPEKNLSMEDAAKMANMSYYNFSRTFNRLLGHSFVDYKNLLRIRQAEELLYQTDKTITEIAELINFGSISYFNRTFKKYNKLTPSDYREKTIQQNKTNL